MCLKMFNKKINFSIEIIAAQIQKDNKPFKKLLKLDNYLFFLKLP
jgi:hypothetical protein